MCASSNLIHRMRSSARWLDTITRRNTVDTRIVPQPLNYFPQLVAEDTQCKKTIVTMMCDPIVEAGLTAKWGNTKTIVKQMRPATHMALTCGTTFMDALSKMVERKQVYALFYHAMLQWNATRKYVACMQLHGLAEEYSTRPPKAGKGGPRWGGVLVLLWSSGHAGLVHPPFKRYATAL